jgi:hypothetical protein
MVSRRWLRVASALLILLGGCSAEERPRAGQPSPVVVLINPVALERTGPKSAIVEYAGDQTSGRFTVLKSGTRVHSGQLLSLPGFTEWGAGKKYFEADFSSIADAGEYEVEVTLGDVSARSPPVRILEHATFATTAAALLGYFEASRHTKEADRRIRIFQTDRFVNVWGGWKDAGGDNGKYLSHLSYANYFNPQQSAFVVWALAKSFDSAPALYREARLDARVVDEVLWGADHLYRLLDPAGYFYVTIFDRWGEPGAERMVTAYEGIDGVYTANYQAAYREGAGIAIAALARAALLSQAVGRSGEFSARQYLADAETAFAHLEKHNRKYCDDGIENIIDDYTALVAATELYRATRKDAYLDAARRRAGNLSNRMTAEGWFVSDAGTRPYYHGAEAGFPVVSLVGYLEIEPDVERATHARETIRRALAYQLALNKKVANPYNYARQTFRTYKEGKLSPEVREGFFMPHANETGYWWQGESARLASLAAAAVLGGRITSPDPAGAFGVSADLAEFAQSQLDWTLGRNPFDVCMLYGFGVKNPPAAESAGVHVTGGISNGITGATASDEGRGIVFAPGPDENNWRWLEQWLPHSAWFLFAVTAMEQPRG